jgi:hypothetical protein
MRSKIFLVGFFAGLLLFGAGNLLSYYWMKAKPALIDAYVSFGLPFKFYASGGFAGDAVLWNNLVADLVIALSVSTLFGWASAKLFGGSGAA